MNTVALIIAFAAGVLFGLLWMLAGLFVLTLLPGAVQVAAMTGSLHDRPVPKETP